MTGAAPRAATAPGREAPYDGEGAFRGRRGAALGAVWVGTFLGLFNVLVVVPALPTIGAGVGASFTGQQLLLNVFTVVFGGLLLPAGAIASAVGLRRGFLVGLVVLGAGSVLCAVAPSLAVLLAGRVVQGAGAALLAASSVAIVIDEFAGRSRARAFAVWSTALAAAAALGPLLGGLVTVGLGWRSLFVATLPVVAGGLVLARRGLADVPSPGRLRGHVIGGLLGSVGGVGVMSALVGGNSLGWTSPIVVALLVGGLAFLGLFVVSDGRQPRPLLDRELVRHRGFLIATAGTLVLAAAAVACSVIIQLFLLSGLGETPLLVGLQAVPAAVVSFVASLVVGRRLRKGAAMRYAGAGLLCAALGTALVALADPVGGWWRVQPGVIVIGAGLGIANPPLAMLASSAATARTAVAASAIPNAARQLGTAFGVAGLGAIYELGLGYRAGGSADAHDLAAHGAALDGVLAIAGAVLGSAALAMLVAARRQRRP